MAFPRVKKEKTRHSQSEKMAMCVKDPSSEGSGSGSRDEFVEVTMEDRDKDLGGARVDSCKKEGASGSLTDGDVSRSDNFPKDKGGKENPKRSIREEEPDTPEGGENGGVSRPPSVQSPKTTIYDPDGDLVLVLGPDRNSEQTEHHLQMSSKLLASTSPVWKDLIIIASASTSGKIMISLTDDFEPFTIFLTIIHLNFSYLPLSITFQEIYELARFSEAYDVHHIFLPFVERWIEPFMGEQLNSERGGEWVLIAWEFCLREVFLGWVEYLCREAEKDAEGKIIYQGKEVAELFPETCRGKYTKYIQERRAAFLSDLLSICRSGFEDGFCRSPPSGKNEVQDQCNAMKNGYLLSGLEDILGKWEWPINASSITMSARAFKEELLNMNSFTGGLLTMKFESLPVDQKKGECIDEDHSECGLSYLKHKVMGYSFERNKGHLEIPMERFGKGRATMELGILPTWKRMGFWRADFLNGAEEDAMNEGDEKYRFSPNTEPREEYQSEGLEDDTNSECFTSSEDEDDEMEVDEGRS